MVPKLHKKGHSFKGCARYVLHDKGADTSERVAWTHTINLPTDDPDRAWRWMAVTAKNADALKAAAGVKNTGRKSNAHVLHLTLSWHPDESDEIDRHAMIGTAESALQALGAGDRQALVVAHNDEPQKHVHVIISRVSPRDGRMLSSSREKLALSAWAEAYEKKRGVIRCHERVDNNAARDRGEYVRGVPSRARNVYERDRRQPANDNAAHEKREREKRRDAEAARRDRERKQERAAAWARLEREHKGRVHAIREETRRATRQAREKVRRVFRERWRELHHRHRDELQEFERRESSLLGRIRNRFRSIDLGRIVSGREKGRAIGEAFEAVTTRAGRLEALQRQHREAEEALKREQRRAEREATREVRHGGKDRLAENRRRFRGERNQLLLAQRMETARHRAERVRLREERRLEKNQLDTASISPSPSRNTPRERQTGPAEASIDSLIETSRQVRRRKRDRERDHESGDRDR